MPNPPTPESAPHSLEEVQALFSDLHKLVHGSRPHELRQSEWNSLDWMMRELDELHRIIEERKQSPRGRAILRYNGMVIEEPEQPLDRVYYVCNLFLTESRFWELFEAQSIHPHVARGYEGDTELEFQASKEAFEAFLGAARDFYNRYAQEIATQPARDSVQRITGEPSGSEPLNPAQRERLAQLQGQYSDYHKAVFGNRPTVSDEQFQSLDWMESAWASLDQEMERRKATYEGREELRAQGWQIPETDPAIKQQLVANLIAQIQPENILESEGHSYREIFAVAANLAERLSLKVGETYQVEHHQGTLHLLLQRIESLDQDVTDLILFRAYSSPQEANQAASLMTGPDGTLLPSWTDLSLHNPASGPYLDAEGMRVSERRVLSSAAGHYIGRTYHDPEIGSECPYSRESLEYYPSREAAQEDLDTDSFIFRPSP